MKCPPEQVVVDVHGLDAVAQVVEGVPVQLGQRVVREVDRFLKTVIM
jgi:hypothetical protein